MRSGHDRQNSEKPISVKKSYKNIKTFFLQKYIHFAINIPNLVTISESDVFLEKFILYFCQKKVYVTK